MWSTIVSKPALTNEDSNPPKEIHHPEFRLRITVLPWVLPQIYEIQLSGQEARMRSEKLRFDLYDPAEDGGENEVEEEGSITIPEAGTFMEAFQTHESSSGRNHRRE